MDKFKLLKLNLQFFATKSYNGVEYDDKTDYAQKISDAKASGASQSTIDGLTAQRNAKIAGEGLNSDGTKRSTASSSGGGGYSANYNRGNGYTNRETAYTWNDNGINKTTYSNAVRYEDALAEAISQGVLSNNAKLTHAATYGTKTRSTNADGTASYGASPASTSGSGIYSKITPSIDSSTGRNAYTDALGHMAIAYSPSNMRNNGAYLDGYNRVMDDFYNYYTNLTPEEQYNIEHGNGTGAVYSGTLSAIRAIQNGYRPASGGYADIDLDGAAPAYDNGYVPIGYYQNSGLTQNELDEIKALQEMYAAAQKEFNETGSAEAFNRMQQAHNAAESIRARYGYSGGTGGSDYIALGNPVSSFYQNETSPYFYYGYMDKPVFDSPYSEDINDRLYEILNKKAFSYDVNKDPLYHQYKNMYLREGQRAMNDTLAAAASGAGGMNSYAVSAASQAQNNYNAQLGDKIPELQQLAYNMYLDDIDRQVQNLGLLQSMENTQYNKYLDELNDYYNERDFMYEQVRDNIADRQWQQQFDYGTSLDSYENAYSQAMEFLSMGIMPSADLLAKAGIGTDEAQAYVSLISGGNKGSGSGNEDESALPVYGASDLSIAGVTNTIRYKIDKGASDDDIGHYIASLAEVNAISPGQARELAKNYGVRI